LLQIPKGRSTKPPRVTILNSSRATMICRARTAKASMMPIMARPRMRASVMLPTTSSGSSTGAGVSSVQQGPVRPLERQRLQCSRHRLVLHQGTEQRQGPLLDRGLGQARQGRPDFFPHPWHGLQPRQSHRLADPFGRPGALRFAVDPRQRLEREPRTRLERAPAAADRQGRGAGRASLVEEDHPGVRIAEPL